MTDSDPLLRAMRDLPPPARDARTRERVLRRAEAAFRGERAPAYRAWTRAALPALLVACEAGYVVSVLGRIAVIFG